ncbi:hypothetical protein THASP1DRAFT_24494 [Thamnocephalis sphaerospora]|uniref:Uncharacterized protein n=1 Tax=Thamnocephalis sphaerospora TaxID=78915 RepID=A0A4P9XPZ6_9FUNG|nr:hypothetical protein THASP1DRAFT_24494 [Thamnocephalis sphaerospora]|eukprot:RKP07340.1 hypothetical protein THASP1DRAFT_24494 [Thamnocephalis sphaerospora]
MTVKEVAGASASHAANAQAGLNDASTPPSTAKSSVALGKAAALADTPYQDYIGLLDTDDELSDDEQVPLAVPLREGDHATLALSVSGQASPSDIGPSSPPPKPPRGRVRGVHSPADDIDSNLAEPQLPPPLPPRSPFHDRSGPDSIRMEAVSAAIETTLGNPSSSTSAAAIVEKQGKSSLSQVETRAVARLLLSDGRFDQARHFIRQLHVVLDDPCRPIDTEADILLGYRPVRRDSTGIDMYDFYEELGAGFYFYLHRATAWEIGRQTDWGDFRVVRVYIKPPYRPGYEEREKVRVFRNEPTSAVSRSQSRHKGSWSGISFGWLLQGGASSRRKYQVDSIIHSSFGYEVLIADAPIGVGTQIKLGASYENQLVRLDGLSLEEYEAPDGGWPVAEHAHTRTHGRLRAMVRRATTHEEEST